MVRFSDAQTCRLHASWKTSNYLSRARPMPTSITIRRIVRISTTWPSPTNHRPRSAALALAKSLVLRKTTEFKCALLHDNPRDTSRQCGKSDDVSIAMVHIDGPHIKKSYFSELRPQSRQAPFDFLIDS